ncbi:MAG TPA: hypothetical protein P5238_08515 [Smithellaceae bacterium]|nr:hypothetical protein [Smithellaceae bacterium]
MQKEAFSQQDYWIDEEFPALSLSARLAVLQIQPDLQSQQKPLAFSGSRDYNGQKRKAFCANKRGGAPS